MAGVFVALCLMSDMKSSISVDLVLSGIWGIARVCSMPWKISRLWLISSFEGSKRVNAAVVLSPILKEGKGYAAGWGEGAKSALGDDTVGNCGLISCSWY